MNVLAALVGSIVVAVATVSLAAHEETFKGKVVSVERASVHVSVVDSTTKKATSWTFKIDAETKVLRGERLVTFATAKIQKDENIAVTVDHDLDINLALVIRLDAVK